MLQGRIIKAINLLLLTRENKNSLISFLSNRGYNKNYLSCNNNFQFASQKKKPYSVSKKPQQKQPYGPIRASSQQLRQQKHTKQGYTPKSLTNPQIYVQLINSNLRLNQAIKLLNRIVNDHHLNKEEFQKNVWKKYCYYVVQVANKALDNLQGRNQKQENQPRKNHQHDIERQKNYQQNNENAQKNNNQLKQIKLNQTNTVTRIDNHQIARQMKQKRQVINFLDLLTLIHQRFKGKLTSSSLTKSLNHICNYYLQPINWKPLHFSQKLIILQSLSRFNLKKAYSLFLKKKFQLHKDKQQLREVQNVIKLLQLMIRLKIVDTQLFQELVIQKLYQQIDYLSIAKIQQLAFLLGGSHKFVNKDFFTKLINRFNRLSRGKQSTTPQIMRMLHIISSFSMIQKNLHLSSIWFQPLDQVYQRLFPYFSSINLNTYKTKYLVTFISTLRRCQFYNDTILNNLASQFMRRQVVQFVGNQPTQRHLKLTQFNSINIAALIQVFFMLASFNYRHTEFMQYFITLLKIVQDSPTGYQAYIPNYSLFSRLLWSMCVLCTKSEMQQLFKLVQHFYKQAVQIPSYQATNFYYCYLLLKVSFPLSQIRWQNRLIQQYINGPKHEIQISSIQKQIHSLLLQIGVPCLLQYNLNNIICDIYIPKFGQFQHFIIEVHGFHHFARNQKRLNGSTVLKHKIVQGEGYYSFYIAIDQYLIADDKLQFVKQFMQQVVTKRYNQKINALKLKKSSQQLTQKMKYLNNQSNIKIKFNKEQQKNILNPEITGIRRLGRNVKKIDLIQ